jgi:hypothetical protein
MFMQRAVSPPTLHRETRSQLFAVGSVGADFASAESCVQFTCSCTRMRITEYLRLPVMYLDMLHVRASRTRLSRGT